MNWMLAFMNTIWYATHLDKVDPVRDLDWVKRFAAKLTGKEFVGDPQSLSLGLIAFREELMALVAALVKGEFNEEAVVSLLNDYMSKSQGHMIIQKEEASAPVLKFEAVVADDAFVLSRLAIECHRQLFEMDKSLVRICENPTCRCYFLDESKNRSKRHCAANCNNAMKARRHRERTKVGESKD